MLLTVGTGTNNIVFSGPTPAVSRVAVIDT